jgi:hypothetical protein
MFVSGFVLLWAAGASAVPKPHVISFGKWTSAKWYVGAADCKPVDLKIRALFVDTRLKEYTTGPAHEVTDRRFVVQRVFRLNDTLPDETGSAPRWQWERGGWLLVDRVTGRVSQINLPEFDPFYSTASWHRDYIILLRRFRRREEAVCDRGAARAPEADTEKAAR